AGDAGRTVHRYLPPAPLLRLAGPGPGGPRAPRQLRLQARHRASLTRSVADRLETRVMSILGFVCLLTFLHYAGAQMRAPVLPLYAAAHDATPTGVGLII